MALSFDPSESRLGAPAPLSRPRLGRTVLIVCEDDGRRRQWSRIVGDLGFRPIAVACPMEGRRLLASLSVRAAIVGHKRDCGAIERARRSLLMVALAKTPTIVVDDAPAHAGDMYAAGHDLLARGARPPAGDMIEITRYQVRRTLADATLRN